MLRWTQQDGVALARLVEEVAPQHGAHVALTGGLLYKSGERKDADLLFYRIRQVPEIDVAGLTQSLEKLGVLITADHGFVKKATWHGRVVDLFFPEVGCSGQPEPGPQGRYS